MFFLNFSKTGNPGEECLVYACGWLRVFYILNVLKWVRFNEPNDLFDKSDSVPVLKVLNHNLFIVKH